MRMTMRRARHVIGAILTVCLVALGIALSPVTSGKAHAADVCSHPSNILGVGCVPLVSAVGGANLVLNVYNESTADGVKVQTWPYAGGHANERWAFISEGDGTFTIRSANGGKCLDATDGYTPRSSWSAAGPPIAKSGAYQSTCVEGAMNQRWYVQPDNHQATWVIRHVADDKCLDVASGWRGEGGDVVLWNCKRSDDASVDNQIWSTVVPSERLLEAAGVYAVKQFDGRSPVIPKAEYRLGSPTGPATRQNPQRLTDANGDDVFSNASAEVPVHYKAILSQTTGYSNAVGVTLGVKATVGAGSASPVKAEIETSLTASYSHVWSGSETYSAERWIDIPEAPSPSKPIKVWYARAQLFQTLSGTWHVTTDRGSVFTGMGASTIPVRNNTDGRTSTEIILCDKESRDPLCVATRPGNIQ
ncbi:RICIN domain-containing protein [Streptomyces sp. NBC_00322]|uniref:RICIN domain-containing protein n=1 Tax=Streptomyces sp. NBC_00322 TaxID=2975712 RepID=UPI003FA6C8F4